MRLVCPHCAAAYDVPPALLAGRRAIRCARCGEEWVEPGAPSPAAEEPRAAVAVVMEAAVRRADPSAPPTRPDPTAIRLAWAASVLVVVLAASGAVAWRTEVMHAWPPSQRAYSAMGLVAR
jgi:predicted Zn finger-like uncharacterized protein